MSDTPLFQNSDEQERAYAPQEVPDADLQAAVGADEGEEGSGRGTSAGAGLDTGSGGGSGGSGGGSGGGGDNSGGITAIPFAGAGTVGYNTSGNLAGAPVDAVDENDDRS